jgi:hypothetical protein
MTIKEKLLEKCIESIQNADPDLMEDKTVIIDLECGTKIVLDVKYVRAAKLTLVSTG